MNNSLEEIRERIDCAAQVYIGGHTNPDGDAIGSCIGLCTALTRAGKKASVYLEEFAEKYQVIPGTDQVQHCFCEEEIPPGSLFVALDCGDKERLGFLQAAFDKMETVNIDHHISNCYFAERNYVDADISSTSELVYHLIHGYYPMDGDTAAALYTGILYDTGGFRHSSVSPVTMAVAAELLTYQIPFTKIYYTLFDMRSFAETKLLGLALERAELLFDGKIAFSYITAADLAKYGGTSKDLDGVVSQLKSVKGIYAAVFLYQKGEQEVKASFRSEDELDVSKIATHFGGGGHVKASGCTLLLSMEEARAAVLSAVEEALLKR